MRREEFLRSLGLATLSAGLAPSVLLSCTGKSSTGNTADSAAAENAAPVAAGLFFKISLAEWSLHKEIFGGQLSNLDFPVKAKNDFGLTAVEYVNQFFKDKAKDQAYLAELKMRCDDHGISSLLIMCDGEGELGHKDAGKRKTAVENHYKWVEAAQFLGCHSIRVNAAGEGSAEEVAKNAADGLHQLATFAKDHNLNVIVENHGGHSSNGAWLSGVMKTVNLPNCGTLPDFGNFCIKRAEDRTCLEEYDRYKGVEELMPYAKGVSAKTYDFDAQGNCVETDYARILKIVKDSGFTGHIGIEYEGDKLQADDGIKATIALLKRVGAELS